MKRAEVIALLQAYRAEIEAFGAHSLSLFGSVARDEARQDSDVDVLVDFTGVPTFDQYMGLRCYLEDLLGHEIDLADRVALRAELRPAIEQEAVAVA